MFWKNPVECVNPLSLKSSALKTNLNHFNARIVSTVRVLSINNFISSCINIYSRSKYFEEKILCHKNKIDQTVLLNNTCFVLHMSSVYHLFDK